MLVLADDRVRLGDQHAAARAWRRGSGCSRCSTPSPRSPMQPATAALPGAASPARIEFRHLTFALRGAARCSTTCRATIEPGQTVALVGATGSGKSTLISLLPRLHEPPPGTVFLDGVDVREMPLAVAARRDRVRAAGAVPLLRHARRQRRVRARARRRRPSSGATRSCRRRRAVARLDKDVADFPNGYDTTVGERGITLSGGQKQRTALARAVALDPRSSSSTTRCRRSTPTPRRRSCRACAA